MRFSVNDYRTAVPSMSSSSQCLLRCTWCDVNIPSGLLCSSRRWLESCRRTDVPVRCSAQSSLFNRTLALFMFSATGCWNTKVTFTLVSSNKMLREKTKTGCAFSFTHSRPCLRVRRCSDGWSSVPWCLCAQSVMDLQDTRSATHSLIYMFSCRASTRFFCSVDSPRTHEIRFLKTNWRYVEEELSAPSLTATCYARCLHSDVAQSQQNHLHLDTFQKRCGHSALKIWFEEESDLNQICL